MWSLDLTGLASLYRQTPESLLSFPTLTKEEILLAQNKMAATDNQEKRPQNESYLTNNFILDWQPPEL